MKNKEFETINKMILYIDKTLKYTKNYTFDKFCNDDKTADASIFNVCQIGELTKYISNETMLKYSNIEWKMIKSLRNRIVHNYDGINLSNIWYIINFDLPELKTELNKILKEATSK